MLQRYATIRIFGRSNDVIIPLYFGLVLDLLKDMITL